jgi:hypothetical protein
MDSAGSEGSYMQLDLVSYLVRSSGSTCINQRWTNVAMPKMSGCDCWSQRRGKKSRMTRPGDKSIATQSIRRQSLSVRKSETGTGLQL